MTDLPNITKPVSRTFTQLPFIFILIIVAIFVMINGKSLFEEWDANYTNVILIYLVMLGSFLLWAGPRVEKQIKTPLQTAIRPFLLGFIVTFFVMLALIYSKIFSPPAFNPGIFWQTVILQFCVVATAEELMFRGVMLDFFSKKSPIFGIAFSSFLFMIWHSVAYSILWYKLSLGDINIYSLAIAFLFGIIMCLVVRKYGLMAAISGHATYNLAILGLLVGGIVI
jgi:membrane protease YdiL (CAAX protease family)